MHTCIPYSHLLREAEKREIAYIKTKSIVGMQVCTRAHARPASLPSLAAPSSARKCRYLTTFSSARCVDLIYRCARAARSFMLAPWERNFSEDG